MFLQPTDLDNAYNTQYDMRPNHPMVSELNAIHQQHIPHSPQVTEKRRSTPIAQVLQQQQQQKQQVTAGGAPQIPTDVFYDAEQFNHHLENEKKMKAYQIAMAQVSAASKENFKNGQDDASYVDKIWSKKRDITKLIMFAFIILLALSVHSCAEFFIQHLFSTNPFTYKQQLLVKIGYAVAVLLILWNIKAFML
jgi:uncharacterized membrane protein YcjF (UPF0283 family)